MWPHGTRTASCIKILMPLSSSFEQGRFGAQSCRSSRPRRWTSRHLRGPGQDRERIAIFCQMRNIRKASAISFCSFILVCQTALVLLFLRTFNMRFLFKCESVFVTYDLFLALL